jgi:hypothetical protein
MSDSDKLRRARLALDPTGAAGMSTERPLDALFPELARTRTAPLARTPMHPRVLEVETDDGVEYTIACFFDPGSQRELHKQVLALVEATLLAELSQSPASIRQGYKRHSGIRLLVFPALPYAIGPAVQAFGFAPATSDPESLQERVKVFAREAVEVGTSLPAQPSAEFFAPIAHPDGALGDKLDTLQKIMADRMGDDVWGATPGAPSKLFALYAAKEFGDVYKPTLDGLRSMELLIVQQKPGAIRWMPPLLFQALCDFIGVLAGSVYERKLSWAVSEDVGSGHSAPPVFRVDDEKPRAIHVPIAHHVLRWSLMPLAPGEQVPSLADWMPDQFARR